MKYIFKIGSISSLIGRQSRLSIIGTCLPSNSDHRLLKPQVQARFELNGANIPLRITAVNRRSDEGPSLLLVTDRDLNFFSALYAVQGEEIPLYVEEAAPRELIEEASALLKVIADKENRKEGDLLKSITAFKPGVQGREDIKFVSPRQLPVVIRVLKERLESHSTEIQS